MEDNNKEFNNGENVDNNKDEAVNEAAAEDILNNLVEDDSIEVKDVIEKAEKKKNKGGFFNKLMVGVVDQAFLLAVSLGVLFVFDFIIRFIGYKVVDRIGIYFIIYVLTNVLYNPILTSSSLKNTIGNKIFNKQ